MSNIERQTIAARTALEDWQ